MFSVDDHPLLREGIAAIINSQPDMTLVAQASNGRDALQRFREHLPDVTLMDLRLPDMSGIDTIIAIRSEFAPRAHRHADDLRGRCGNPAGPQSGRLRIRPQEHAPPKDLVEAIRQVHAGKKRIPPDVAAHLAEHLTDEALTEREIDVLRCGPRQPESRHRRAAVHFRGDGQGAHEAHHGEAGCERSPQPWRSPSGAGIIHL